MKMQAFSSIVVVLSIIAILSASNAQADEPAQNRPPNFVFIFADDLGYGDIRPFNANSAINTPHLNRMAEEGMKLSSFYSVAPVCTPSRAGLLTGSYPRRIEMLRGPQHAVLFPGDPVGLNPNEITIADMLGDAGYATGIFGKWHLGDQDPFLPTEQGFDEYFGIPYSNDMWSHHPNRDFPPLPLMRNTEVVGSVDNMQDQADLERLFFGEASDFIERNHEQPFFAYIPNAFPHHPRSSSEEFLEQAGGDVTLAQILELDYRTGQVLNLLEEKGIAEDTLVMFTSDNGPSSGLSSGPLRGGKGSAWEGGFRVPTLAWWPGQIAAGSATDEVTATLDLLPTFAELAGGSAPTDRVIDGQSIASLLLNDGTYESRERFYYDSNAYPAAVRSGAWKLFHDGRLYNLDEDIGETTNVAQHHPEVVNQLQGYLDEYSDIIEQDIRPRGQVDNPQFLIPHADLETNYHVTGEGRWDTALPVWDEFDANGDGKIGSDGFIFFGAFTGGTSLGDPWGTDVRDLPDYVISLNPGDHFSHMATTGDYAEIDDPIDRDGLLRISGALATLQEDGWLEAFTFTLDDIDDPVRVGLLFGMTGNNDGRWDPGKVRITNGSTTITVDDLAVTFGPNPSWLFFDLDEPGTYSVQAERIDTHGVTIGGATFQTIPEPTSAALLGLGLTLMLMHRRRYSVLAVSNNRSNEA